MTRKKPAVPPSIGLRIKGGTTASGPAWPMCNSTRKPESVGAPASGPAQFRLLGPTRKTKSRLRRRSAAQTTGPFRAATRRSNGKRLSAQKPEMKGRRRSKKQVEAGPPFLPSADQVCNQGRRATVLVVGSSRNPGAPLTFMKFAMWLADSLNGGVDSQPGRQYKTPSELTVQPVCRRL